MNRLSYCQSIYIHVYIYINIAATEKKWQQNTHETYQMNKLKYIYIDIYIYRHTHIYMYTYIHTFIYIEENRGKWGSAGLILFEE